MQISEIGHLGIEEAADRISAMTDVSVVNMGWITITLGVLTKPVGNHGTGRQIAILTGPESGAVVLS